MGDLLKQKALSDQLRVPVIDYKELNKFDPHKEGAQRRIDDRWKAQEAGNELLVRGLYPDVPTFGESNARAKVYMHMLRSREKLRKEEEHLNSF
jgi:hypothetical protein